MTVIANESAVTFRENNHHGKKNDWIQIDSDIKFLFFHRKKNVWKIDPNLPPSGLLCNDSKLEKKHYRPLKLYTFPFYLE